MPNIEIRKNKFSLRKIFGLIELILGCLLILSVIIGSYFVFSVIPSNLLSKGNIFIDEAANKDGFEAATYTQPLNEIVPLFIYGFGGIYLLIFLLIGMLFIFQGIINIRED